MRAFIALLLLLCSTQFSLQAQNAFHLGYFANPSLNLYQRTHQPRSAASSMRDRSSGQGLNLLPDLNVGLWAGQTERWVIGLETGISYQPFSFNLQDYQGMGALFIPLTLRSSFPILKQQSSSVRLGIAASMQWNKTEIHHAKNSVGISDAFYKTYGFELSAGLGAVSQKGNQLRGGELFFRFGFGADAAMTFQTGLRFNFWNAFLSFSKKKKG